MKLSPVIWVSREELTYWLVPASRFSLPIVRIYKGIMFSMCPANWSDLGLRPSDWPPEMVWSGCRHVQSALASSCQRSICCGLSYVNSDSMYSSFRCHCCFFFIIIIFFLNVGCSQLEFDSCSVCSIQQRATVDFNGLIGRFVECRFPLRLNQVCLAIITNCLSTVRNWIIHEIKPLSRYLTFQSKVGVSVNSNEF